MNRDEYEQDLQRKLAVAVEALNKIVTKALQGRQVVTTAENALAAITSNAPANPTHQHAPDCLKLYGGACDCDAKPIDNGPEPARERGGRPPHAASIGGSGPASKPLVEGFTVGDLVCVARDYGYTWQSNFWVNPDNVEHVTANAHRYRRVEPEPGQVYPGPSAKADEGKACKSNPEDAAGGTGSIPGRAHLVADPAKASGDDDLGTSQNCPVPPTLTRSDVVEMFVRYHNLDEIYLDSDVRAALSDGGSR